MEPKQKFQLKCNENGYLIFSPQFPAFFFKSRNIFSNGIIICYYSCFSSFPDFVAHFLLTHRLTEKKNLYSLNFISNFVAFVSIYYLKILFTFQEKKIENKNLQSSSSFVGYYYYYYFFSFISFRKSISIKKKYKKIKIEIVKKYRERKSVVLYF